MAGVSVTTVSRFLNGSLELPAQTRVRIQAAVASLNYRPNPHARRLSLGRSETMGLVVPDIANPFFATFVAAVEEEADRRGLALGLYVTLNRPGREKTYLDLVAHNHVDGVIFVTNHSDDDGSLAKLINATGRVVVVDEDVPGARAPKLFCDNEDGGRLAGRHLAEAGHRRILFVGGRDQMISGRARHAGLRTGLVERGVLDAPLRYEGEYTVQAGREAARRFLEEGRPATAIFASSDEIAIGMIEIFREAGLSIPDEVSMIGFDDVGPLHLFHPPLTAIRQPVRDIGRRALELLIEQRTQQQPMDELLPVDIVVRGSVAPPAIA